MSEKNYRDIIDSWREIYIFGAGVRGRTLRTYLSVILPQIKIAAFLVSAAVNNPPRIEGITVEVLPDKPVQERKAPVLVATKMMYHKEVQQQLQQAGFMNIVLMTPEWDNVIKRLYFERRFVMEGKPFRMLPDMAKNPQEEVLRKDKIAIYAVKSIYDKEADVSQYDKWWIRNIQAGAALTEQTIADVKDNTGENISHKNSSYCELTAIYWIWKNITTEYAGICHYRRRFELTEAMLSALTKANIDVVLPVPTGCEPSVRANYFERHREEDWNMMMQVLQNNYPEYYTAAKEVFEDNYYYACNMWIMRQEVRSPFCSWLFGILKKVEQLHGGQRNTDEYQGRYIGFLAERLTTLYFRYHEEELKIAYAEKVFIGRDK